MANHRTPPPTNEDMVNAATVGRGMGVHPKTVLRWASEVDGFPCYPIGAREKRFLLSEVKAFVMAHPERMRQASEDYSSKRTLAAAKKKPAKKAPK